MIGQPRLAFGHDVSQQPATGATRKGVGDWLADAIVWGGGPEVDTQGGRAVGGGMVEQQVAIADASGKLPASQFGKVAGEPSLAGREQRGCLVSADVVSGEVLHDRAIRTATDRDQIAPHRPVVRAEFDALGRCLQRSSAGEAGQRVIAEQAHAGHFRAWVKAVGNVVGATNNAFFGQRVEGGGTGGSQRRLAPQRILRLVSGTIRNDNKIFHA